MAALKEFEKEEVSVNGSQTITELNALSDCDYRAQFLRDYHHCSLCGTELVFTHNTNFISLNVKEEAFCPACHICTKQENHCLN